MSDCLKSGKNVVYGRLQMKEKDNAIVAAITMALDSYLGNNIHDEESGILTIRYVNKHWNNLCN